MSAKSAAFFGIVAIFAAPRLWLRHNNKLEVFSPPELYIHLEDIWSESDLASLMKMAEEQRFSTAVEYYLSDHNKVPDITIPRGENGECHWLFFPKNKEECAMIGRIDSYIPFMLTGGKSGAKVSPQTMTSIGNTFQLYLFGEDKERPEFQKLFQSKVYKDAAAKICGMDHQDRMQIQISMIAYLPGQELPDHYDVPWFTDANRHNTPQWLLFVMEKSGLFDDHLMPQIQGVGFFQKNKTITGGEFVFYDKGPGAEPTTIPSTANTVILMDGSKIIHGVNRVLPDRDPPPTALSRAHITYNNSRNVWDLQTQSEEILNSYRSEDLRMSIAWRTLCFKSEKEREEWNPLEFEFDMEPALKILEADLRKRGRLTQDEPRPSQVDFALMLVDEYVHYPVGNLNSAWFPYNYCMLPHLAENKYLKKTLDAAFSYIC